MKALPVRDYLELLARYLRPQRTWMALLASSDELRRLWHGELDDTPPKAS